MLKESQGNGMAEIKKLRHHLLVMATCLTMVIAGSCFAASAADEAASVNGATNNDATSTEESADVETSNQDRKSVV